MSATPCTTRPLRSTTRTAVRSMRHVTGALALLVTAACGGAPAATSTPDAPSSVDAAPVADAAPVIDADPATAPIVAAADTWTWVDFPQTRCAGGTATGIGVNPHAGAADVVIFLEGGGACTNALACWGPIPSALHLDGYDATTFATAKQRAFPLFDRVRSDNPFAAENFVFVPYCTGDMHAGTATTSFIVHGAPKPTYFWGGLNLDQFLARLAPTFPLAKRVWLVGGSAGGYGTILAFDRVAQAFHTRVDVIDDSGPAIVAKGATDNAASLATWGFVPPAGCAPCTKFSDVLAADRALQPASKYAFLSFTQDTTISRFFGYTIAEYPAVMAAYAARLAGDPNAATFLFSNEQSHVVQSDPALAAQYLPWFTALATDDPTWGSRTYP